MDDGTSRLCIPCMLVCLPRILHVLLCILLCLSLSCCISANLSLSLTRLLCLSLFPRPALTSGSPLVVLSLFNALPLVRKS